MTPLHFQIFIHFWSHVGPYPNESGTSIDYTEDMVEKGLLRYVSDSQSYAVTEKGRVWFERVLLTPMPVQKWVFED